MGLGQRFEQRIDPRDARFSGDFSVSLVASDNVSKLVKLSPIDVSRRGLGFLSSVQMRPGSFYTLRIGAAQFRIELAYCNPYSGGAANLFRGGLFLRDIDGDIRDACIKAGLLSDQNAAKP